MTSAMSTPTSASASIDPLGAVEVGVDGAGQRAVVVEASRVASGIVLTVSGPMRVST